MTTEHIVMVTKCLELAKQMLDANTTFDLEVKLGKEFFFTFTSQKKQQEDPSSGKKQSPSVINRNSARQKAYHAKKGKEIEETKGDFIDEVVDAKQKAVKPTEADKKPSELETNLQINQESENNATIEKIKCSNFKYDQCDFVSNRKVGMRIHKGKKHRQNNDLFAGSEMKDYASIYYWAAGNLGTSYQIYQDVLEDIKNSDLNLDERKTEIENVKSARLKAWVAAGGFTQSCNM